MIELNIKPNLLLTRSYVKKEIGTYTILFSGKPLFSNDELKNQEWTSYNLNNLAKKYRNIEDFCKSILHNSQGPFSILVSSGDKILLATDNIRSIPFFYGTRDGELFITDDLNQFQKRNGRFDISTKKTEEFIAAGFVFGNRTIFKNVYQVQAGDLVVIQDDEIQSQRYFRYIPSEDKIDFDTISDFTGTFNEVLKSAFSRMVKQTPDVNRWIVPLSGGHDSRIIVNTLYQMGIRNVICYSYGTPGNLQSKISKQVAEEVGYEWHFIKYTEGKWGKLHENGLIDEYIDYSFQGVSTPHLQDLLAVYELKERGIISGNDVFVPGHALDFIAGSHLSQYDCDIKNTTEAINRVIGKFIDGRANTNTIKVLDSIFDTFDNEPAQFQEYINWQERQAKFIVNSCRVYNFFGFDFRLPFWEKEFVEFWMRISPADRLNRNLFLKAERGGVLIDELAEIPFEDELNAKNSKKEIIRQLKSYIPNFIKLALLKATGRKLRLAEGLNLIYSNSGETVNDLIGPLEDFPNKSQPIIKPFLNRYPYQMDYHFLSRLYSLRRAYNKQDKAS